MICSSVELGRDNDARLQRVRTALALGRGFQLFIVEVEPGPIRREVLRRVQTWSHHHETAETLAAVMLDPEATLAAQLERPSGGAMVMGLEPPSPTEASPRDWVAELNTSRDLLPQLVPGPLVLMVSQAMNRSLFERAPDLYSWRRSSIHITLTARELALPLCSPGDPYWLEQRERISHILALDPSPTGRMLRSFDLSGVLLALGDERAASRALDEVEARLGPEPDDQRLLESVKLRRAECALARRDLAAASALLDDIARAQVVVRRDWLALVRGMLHAAGGAWDPAIAELESALDLARDRSWTAVISRAREYLAQVELARGDITRARSAIASFIEVARARRDVGGFGMLLRLATAAGDLYPDEIAPLLEAALAAAESLAWREARLAVQFARARRAWLLDRGEAVRDELAHARALIHPEDPDEPHGFVRLYEAASALVEGGRSQDDLARHLARAGELLRATAPKQAAIAGRLLGELRASLGRYDLAAAAHRAATEDARGAGAVELAHDAELSELEAAVQGELEQEDVPDRLRALAERSQTNEHMLREGIARVSLGRALLRRSQREAAAVELERARACFEATTDAARELEAAKLLEAARPAVT